MSTGAPQTSLSNPPLGTSTSFIVFAVCWIALAIASSIFYAKASYETKKSVHPFLMAGVAVVFLGFAEWITGGHLPLFFIAGVIVIMFLNCRLTRFCSSCGATIYPRYVRMNLCPKCGAVLH